MSDNEEEADVSAMLDLSKKKKKKKKKKETSSGAADGGVSGGGSTKLSDEDIAAQQELLDKLNRQQQEAFEQEGDDNMADYTYEDLLDRVVDLLQANNPDLVEKKRTRIKPPQLQRLPKKTLWVNFQEICTMMQRDPQHVFQFFMAELGTEGNFDGSHRLVIRGKFIPKTIESLLKKYAVEYVTCTMCRSPNTDLAKDSHSRLYFCHCRDCGSSRSVAPIRAGYHATSRADRRAARAAM